MVGLTESGGTKILVEAGDTSIFLDFGFAFGAEARYYEEYLQPRSSSKLRDLLELELVPALDGIYRRDALRPNGLDQLDDNLEISLWDCDLQSYESAANADEWTPDAVFLSHAHLDHAGYLPYLGDIPIHCSDTTRTVLETIGDIGNLQGFDSELLETERREVDFYQGGYFPSAPKISRADTNSRQYESLVHSGRNVIGDIELEAFDVGHSIPGAFATLIESRNTQILYTGDLRFHGRSGIDLGEELRGLRPDVLLCEGTRIDEEEADDEQRVQDEMTAAIRDTDGLAMVGFAWKDLERYETVRRAAERADRIPVFDPRLAYLKAQLGDSVYAEGASVFVERSGSMLYSPGDYTRSKHKLGELPISEWDSSAGMTDTKHLDEGTTATEIRNNPERYVLQLDYFRFKNLVDLDPPAGSTYIRAQTEPFNDEMEISEERMTNWLAHYDINPHLDHDPVQIHASGHASGPELQAMIDKIKPRTVVPIHTEHPGAFSNEAGDVVLPERGTAISI